MPDPAPVCVNTPNVLDLRFIVVSVRTDFRFVKKDGSVIFHYAYGEEVPKATVELKQGGQLCDKALTDSSGQATLETSALPEGDYTVTVTPEHSINALAGPDILENETSLPNRLFRPLVVNVRLSGGSISAANIDAKTNGLDVLRYASLGNRTQPLWPPKTLPTDLLPIDLKPIWMLGGGANAAPVRRTDEIKMIVVHNTGADTLPEAIIGPDIGTFTGNDPNHQIHYLMDLNGHVMKFMKDKTKANHAPGMWFGFDNVNGSNPHDSSIGIEVVHKEGPTEYTDDQYTVLPQLIRSLQGAYGLDARQIVGHSDVAVLIPAIAIKRSTPTHTVSADTLLLDGDRPMDPGQVFRWEKLEALGLGMVPQNSVLQDGAYSGLFDVGSAVVLRAGDNDRHHQYGGKSLPHTLGKPIEDLQTHLRTIGYSLKITGTFDNYTLFAVQAFQRHFFSGTRTRSAGGTIDRETAQMIKNVKG